MATVVKQEQVYDPPSDPAGLIDLCDSDEAERPVKRREEEGEVVLPLGFLDPLPREEVESPEPIAVVKPGVVGLKRCRQFWKAGDFDRDAAVVESGSLSVGMDHVRVHPKFLHSNATSHKWALGAFAELLDNALDEVCYGATFVNIDVLDNKKDGTKMILVEDNGGGMDPDRMRQCMSLGYSAKSKMANTIGQYGNGFKTSTMRLGADVIVFSRCLGKDGKSPTQSIGMLSYTFLRNTGKEDIVVPMLDYEKGDSHWNRMPRMTLVDWNKNLETVLQWSPYSSEAELLGQFRSVSDQGTRIVIYNIWEDDQGELELDFNADKQDIQLRGVNRDEKKIKMAVQFPNLRHFLTYQHSLRSYASILYLRLPPNFRIILRGAEMEHHNITNDMIMKQEITYRPQHSDSNRIVKDTDLVAVVTIGFVKDAKDHVDVQGFNVYHKNRLIKPFWRLWNAAGSDGRGVIGVLEANFVEPAHDKQGFERTTVLSRLETRLIQMQKQYWRSNCHKIGYAPRQNGKLTNGLQDGDRDSSPEDVLNPPSSWPNNTIGDAYSRKVAAICKPIYSPKLQSSDRQNLYAKGKSSGKSHYLHPTSHKTGVPNYMNGHFSPFMENNDGRNTKNRSAKYGSTNISSRSGSDSDAEFTIDASGLRPGGLRQGLGQKTKALGDCNPDAGGIKNLSLLSIEKFREENHELSKKLKEMEESMTTKLQFERDRNRLLLENLEVAERKLEEMNKEQEALIDIFSEERSRRDKEEEALRKKLKDASTMIQELREKAENRNGVNRED